MADSYIVPPIDDSPDALRIFYDQICELLNPATELVQDGAEYGIPDDVVGLTASGGFGSVTLNFSDVTYVGHQYTIFARATDGIFANSIPVGSTTTNRYVDSIANPVIGTTYTYWATNVSISGDTSLNWSAAASAVVSADVDYSVDLLLGKLGYEEFDSAAGVYPVRTEDVLPVLPDEMYPLNTTILLTTNQKLYVNRSGIWVYKVEAGDIEDNAITANTIEANAIVAGKIAAGALVVDDAVMQNAYIKTALMDIAEINNAQVITLDADKINAGTVDVSLVLNSAIINTPELNSADINGGTIDGTVITGGTLQTNTSPASAGGIKMIGDTLTVYDASGNVRVVIGDLS